MSDWMRRMTGIVVSKEHVGPVIQPSRDGFDSGGSAWGCAFVDPDDSKTTYLYYSGSEDTTWTRTAIGIAVSSDGVSFRKLEDINPVLEGQGTEFNSGTSITPAVVRIGNRYYMFFAGGRKSDSFPRLSRRTRIGMAYADDPRGPWVTSRSIATPKLGWEGLSIDLGPSVVSIGEDEVLAYYSNSLNNLPLSLLGTNYMKHLRRRIGILKIKVRSPSSVTAHRSAGNPLPFNGPKGSPGESLFCPGHFLLGNCHYLVPTMSTYSCGFPFRQYIGLIADSTPYFSERTNISILIDGPAEKETILGSKDQVAFDTPSPVVRNDQIYLYYSVMDRRNSVWKTALTLIKTSS
jgi:hypothetical protein